MPITKIHAFPPACLPARSSHYNAAITKKKIQKKRDKRIEIKMTHGVIQPPGQSWFIIIREIWKYLVQRLSPEKYENISSRDYVPKYLKLSRAESMSRSMGREYPAPKPFNGYLYIWKISRPETMSREIWKYLVQRLCPEKSENISSRD